MHWRRPRPVRRDSTRRGQNGPLAALARLAALTGRAGLREPAHRPTPDPTQMGEHRYHPSAQSCRLLPANLCGFLVANLVGGLANGPTGLGGLR